MPKFKDYYQQMIDQNSKLFSDFLTVHAKYAQDKSTWQTEFNTQGKKVVEVIRDWERRLCSAMGKGAYSQYSHKLSEKFWALVRSEFALIDLVGVTIKKK